MSTFSALESARIQCSSVLLGSPSVEDELLYGNVELKFSDMIVRS